MRGVLLSSAIIVAATGLLAACGGAETSTGELIAFSSDQDGDWDVFVLDPATSIARKVTNNGADDWSPSFSPNDGRIVYATNYADGEIMDTEIMDSEGNPVWITGEVTGVWDLYAMATNGDDIVQLTDTVASDDQPVWSPDGTLVAFQTQGDYGTQIFLIKPDGTDLTQLTYSSGNNWSPAWSPDGTLLAFSSDRTGDWEIYTMTADGTDLTQITHSPSTDVEPVWSPDGTTILFASSRRGPQELFTIPSTGGEADALGQAGLPSHWIQG